MTPPTRRLRLMMDYARQQHMNDTTGKNRHADNLGVLAGNKQPGSAASKSLTRHRYFEPMQGLIALTRIMRDAKLSLRYGQGYGRNVGQRVHPSLQLGA